MDQRTPNELVATYHSEYDEATAGRIATIALAKAHIVAANSLNFLLTTDKQSLYMTTLWVKT